MSVRRYPTQHSRVGKQKAPYVSCTKQPMPVVRHPYHSCLLKLQLETLRIFLGDGKLFIHLGIRHVYTVWIVFPQPVLVMDHDDINVVLVIDVAACNRMCKPSLSQYNINSIKFCRRKRCVTRLTEDCGTQSCDKDNGNVLTSSIRSKQSLFWALLQPASNWNVPHTVTAHMGDHHTYA